MRKEEEKSGGEEVQTCVSVCVPDTRSSKKKKSSFQEMMFLEQLLEVIAEINSHELRFFFFSNVHKKKKEKRRRRSRLQIDTRHPWRATIYHTLRTHIYIRAKPAAFVERRGVVHLCWFCEVRITAHFGSFFHVQSLPLCARKKKRQAVTQSLADAAKILHTAAIFFFQCSFFFFVVVHLPVG